LVWFLDPLIICLVFSGMMGAALFICYVCIGLSAILTVISIFGAFCMYCMCKSAAPDAVKARLAFAKAMRPDDVVGGKGWKLQLAYQFAGDVATCAVLLAHGAADVGLLYASASATSKLCGLLFRAMCVDIRRHEKLDLGGGDDGGKA
jgi:hypothetical protein